VLAIAFDRDTFLDKESSAASPWAGLLDLGVGYLTLRKGDDLVRVFNP
jgi:hypothetical protein